MRNGLRIGSLVAIFLLACPGAGGADAPPAGLTLTPNAVPIGLFYNEGRVAVTGTLPEGCAPALIVQGADEDATMNIRGRNYGLWMAVGTARFQHVPAFYQCLTAQPVERIADPDVLRENGLTDARIKESMQVEVETSKARDLGMPEEWKEEFVYYMERNGLYAFRDNGLRVTPGADGTEQVEGEIVLPARVPEGSYRVALVGFRDGSPAVRAEETLSVQLVGPVAFLRNLAMHHGWIYGLVAVMVALTAGFGVGAVIPSKGGH